MLMPSICFETVMNFTWQELSGWHELAITMYKSMHGIQ
jgi:hypothetical protein